MKISRLFISAVAIIGLSACSGSSTADTTTTTTTVAVTTTTVELPDCSQAALDAASGEATFVLGCASDWAAVQLKSEECGEHCNGYIFKWTEAKWNLQGMCSQYSPITKDAFCDGLTGLPKDKTFSDPMTEFPSKEIACQIWLPNRFPENVATTGCMADPAN